MAQIILDISANTFKNDIEYAKRMIDEIKAIDTGKHEIIFKTQLFKDAPPNLPLKYYVFDYIYDYANKLGYKVTSSVFDKESLDFLLEYDVPFVKIANNRDLDCLIGEIPRKIPVYISADINNCVLIEHEFCIKDSLLACVSKYPTTIREYKKFRTSWLKRSISDHTTNWDLFNKYKPEIYECHYVLDRDENNPDGGMFARTIDDLREIL